MKSSFNELAERYPLRNCEHPDYQRFVDALTQEFTVANVTAESVSIPRYDFKWTTLVYGAAALISSLMGLIIPVAGVIASLAVWVLATREFSRPLLAKLHIKQARNLYFTIPARSKETQKLFLVTTYATDQPFPKPDFLTNQRYLSVLSFLYLMFPLLNTVSYFNKVSLPIYFALLPAAAILYWISFNPKAEQNRYSLGNIATLAELEALLLKARPLSTTVTFAFIGTRAVNSGILALAEKLKSGPKLTYIVNLTETPRPDAGTLQIVTAEGNPMARSNDPTLVELLQIVADEKGLGVSKTKFTENTEIFPLLLPENKVVSVGNNRIADSSSNRDLRELLAGLIRKLEH